MTASNPPVLVVPRPGSDYYPAIGAPPEISVLPIVSIREIMQAIGRRFWPAAIIVVVAVLSTFTYLLIDSPTYLAVTKVLVHVGREKLSPLVGGPSSNFVFNERPENVNDEVEILQSSAVLDRVFPILQKKLEELEAARREDDRPPKSLIEWVKFGLRAGKRLASETASWLVDAVKEPLYEIGFLKRLSPETQLREKLMNAVRVAGIKETNVFVVSFSWSDPDFAAFALNALTNAYLQERMRVQEKLAGPVRFYQDQQKRVAEALAATTTELEAYTKANGTSDPIAEKQTQLQLIGQLEKQLSDDVAATQQTRERLHAVRHPVDPLAWPSTPGVPQEAQGGLVDLDVRYAQLSGSRNKLLAQWQPDSPMVVDVDAQIARLKLQKQQALLSYLGDRLRVQEQAVNSISRRLMAARAELNRLREAEAGYLALQARRDQQLSQLKEYEHQIGQLAVQRALNSQDVSSISILNRGSPPDVQSGPRKGLVMGLATLFALLLAGCYIMLMEFFDRTVSNERELEAVLGLPVIGRVPNG